VRVLGLETATAVCAAAVAIDGTVAAERLIVAPRAHAEKLLTLAEESLALAGVRLADLDGFAVSIGPGSFTGLRIGLSTAKGFAFATRKPVLAVPTLAALAYEAVRSELVGEDEYIVPMIDARRDEVYIAIYRRSGQAATELSPARAIHLHEIPALLPERGRLLLMGDGAEKFFRSPHRAGERVVLPATGASSTGASVALLGEIALRRGDGSDGADLEPLYVKEFYTTATIQQQVKR